VTRPPQSTTTPAPRSTVDSALSASIIEDAEDAIIAKGLDGTVTTWNAGAERLFGYTAAEMIGCSITRLFPPDRLHEEGELIARLVLGKTISHFITRRVRKDGVAIDVSVTLSPVRDASGTIVAVSKIARDITGTEQRNLDFARYAAIVEHSDDAIISKTLDGTVLTWNSGAARIFGYSAAEMIGGPVTRLFPAERMHEEAELIAQLAQGKQISHFVTRRVRKNGSPIDVSVTLSPIRDAAGRIIAISKIARDITEAYQRQLASALAAAIVEHSDDAIISKTLDGTVISWNLGAQQIFGYTATEMIGGSITRLLPDDRFAEQAELISQVVLGKGVDHFVTRRLRKDGTTFDVMVTLTPVRDPHGRIVAVSTIAREVVAARQPNDPADPSFPVTPELAVRQPAAQSRRRARVNRLLKDKIDELARNDQRFQTLVRLTSQVIWTNSPEGRMEGAQPGWSAFTGQSFDDYQGFGWSFAVHPEDAQPTIDAWQRCVADRRAFVFEHRVRRHDGAYRNCTINAAPVLNDDGSIREWVGVHNDITERRQQENEIRAQEARFRFLTESLPQIVWTSRPDGWLDYYNQRWFDYAGIGFERTQGWGWGPVLHPDDLENIVRLWSHSVETGEPLQSECRFRRASDDTYRWHLNRAVPLRDAHGAIVAWFGTSTDIHDYKEAEARNLALRAELEDRVQQRTAELARVGNIAGIGGWSITVASGDFYWSDETCRILDVPPGHQPTRDEAFGLYGRDARELIEAACRNCLANAVPFDLELPLTTAKGRRIWARAVGEAQLQQGAVVSIFGALQDNTTRKLAELGFLGQHELLRVTLESIADGVITTDAQGRVQSMNPIAARLIGRSASECIGCPVDQVFDIVDTKTKRRASELIARALANESAASTGLDTVLIAADGAEISIEDSIAPIRDKSGHRVGTVLVFRDVQERKRAAQALRVANERFALAGDAAGIGVWDWDLETNSVRWDDRMYRLYGRDRVAGAESHSLWMSCLHSEDRARTELELRNALRNRTSFDTEFRIVCANGEIRYLKAFAQTQRNGAGEAIRMIGVNFDITARKQAQQSLEHTSSLLRQVLDSATELSIIATTPDFRISVFNKGAERLLGFEGVELIGDMSPMAFHDVAEVKARELELSTLLARSVQGAGVFTDPETLGVPREWTYIRKDQRRVPVLLNCSAMFDDSGTLNGYLGIARDITRDREHERYVQEAKSEAERANAAKSEFLANMSHEIRTPLNAVIGLGYLLEQTTLSEDQRQLLAKIQFAGRSLLGVVNNVLDLSKIEAGEMTLETESFDLPEMLRAVSQMLAPDAVKKGIELLMSPSPSLPATFMGDQTRLRQLLVNLVSNAIKFTETGSVQLRMFNTAEYADTVRMRCEVQDTGIGIARQALERLFTPFTQADTSTTRRFGGTGLGLSISRRLVHIMGGEIGVSSDVGRGSTFWFEIPLTIVRKASRSKPPHGLRILIAASRERAESGLGAQIRALGWNPQLVSSGKEVRELLAGLQPVSKPDLIIAELHLEDIDALKLIAQLDVDHAENERSPNRSPHRSPIIVIAGSTDAYLEFAPMMRADDLLLAEPVTSSALFNAVNSVVFKRDGGLDHLSQTTNFAESCALLLSDVRILVADDSSINLEVARRVLERQGAQVETCADGLAAVAYVAGHAHELDIILMDVQMPVLDGNAAANRIRKELQLASLPILALTAGALVGERQRCLDSGMNDVVTKPFDPQTLIRKVRDLIDDARGAAPPIVALAQAPAMLGNADIPGSLDASVVEQMFGDDVELFRKLLKRLVREFADLALPVAPLPEDEGSMLLLQGRVHKLKGSSGMIGAASVARSAGALEAALMENLDAPRLHELAARLAVALTTLAEESRLYFQGLGQPRGSAWPEGLAETRVCIADLDELRALLDTHDLSAMDKFAEMTPSLRRQFDQSGFERLSQAVDDLEFGLAAQLLQQAM
jgi:PAS domain S-box-containing protein